MADLYNPNTVPHGMGTATVAATVYKVNDPGSSNDEHTDQIIHEPDENGEAQSDRFAIIKGEELVERTLILQRVDAAATPPAVGAALTYDHDRSGTASTWRTRSPSTVRGRPDTFSVPVILETYQG